MIRSGVLCKSCRGGKCHEITDTVRIEIPCTECEGRGCDHCDRGSYVLDDCPKATVGMDIVNLVRCADLTEKGLPPIAGGSLDQSHWFMEAASYFWSEMADIENERNGN